MTDGFTFHADDGRVIYVHRWLPAEPPRAILQIVHGMSEHAGRYADLAHAMVQRGWGVYADDHRGHGRSVPEGEEPGHMADDDAFGRTTADVHRLNELITDRHPGAPRVLFGHSMGSFVLQQLLGDHPGDAIGFALSASNGRPPPIAAAGKVLARLERLRVGARGTSRLLKALSFDDFNKRFAPNRTEFDWLSRDESEVDKYVADPMCGFSCSTQSWIGLLDALPRLTSPEHLSRIPKNMPIYLFAGTEDPVGGRAGVRSLVDAYRAAWLTNVDVVLYEGARHETLHETNKQEVADQLIAWCERLVAKSSDQRAAS
jgi:alpha-beta hydrolase superfamily lysophospholipase